MLLGFSIGLLVAVGLNALRFDRFGIGMGGVALGVSLASISVWIAERRGKVKSFEEIDRPIELFHPTEGNSK